MKTEKEYYKKINALAAERENCEEEISSIYFGLMH